MAACGAAPSSGRPIPTTTSASSTTRCSASRPTAPRSSPRSPRRPSPRPTSRSGRSSCARARNGRTASPSRADDILFWYNDVLLNKELTPTLPGWIKQRRRLRRQGREGRRRRRSRFTYAAPATLFLDGRRQPGRRRPHLRDVPAGALPQEVPSRPCTPRPTSRRWRRRPASRPGPSCSPTGTRRRRTPSGRRWPPGRRAAAPAIRSSPCSAIPTMSASTRTATSCPIIDEVRFTYFADAQALNLAAIAGSFDMQERHINMTNYPVLKDQEKTGQVQASSPGRPSAAPTRSSPSTRPTRPIRRWAR